MTCPDCGLKIRCRMCSEDDDDYEPVEMTAADELAYERYKERADFDYWHRFS